MAEKIIYHTIISELAGTVRNGGQALYGETMGTVEHVGLQEDGEATLYDTPFPYFNGTSVTRGLKLAGVMRRKGIRRQFMECAPKDVKPGDKAILEDEEGLRMRTLKLRSFLDPDVVRQAQESSSKY